ncbi:Succinylglutamate desuccinylase/aspartoacylase [Stanieria cyanosphaera PCC 7437]|uniref:Succinylglutamate desuccinylase/aspartoacylase n=1 Tax=Stanieria cyanosphaera (strain ATCC 29371 / PCC 7437) TaxID=111780 RepID=K9XR55_STAC7|nr:succinylglutamate desuccinylase/aspartoacylase family protein [Stanieria cyanosphaera]AFZ34142.1 Succinylglutamate desuccinylase/aspartoacylase [Stanieria cyanosphaera PCC 7437]
MTPIISNVELCKLASGDFVSLQVYKFIGEKRGKKVYIQANLHGSEIVGNAVIHQLIEYLSTLEPNQITGEIWLVPVCNPLGINQRHHVFSTGRFSSYDGKNWNRIFWDYEKECLDLSEFARSQLNKKPEIIRKNYLEKIYLAWQQQLEKINQPSSIPLAEQYRYRLQSLCLDADYVIDIHSSSNQGIDYLFCFQGSEESAKYFLFEYGILMTEYEGEAFDEAFLKPWLALEKELANLGKVIKFDLESWTLELGTGMQINPLSVVKGVKGIKNYLAYKNVLSAKDELQTESIKLVNKNKLISYHAPTGGMIQNRVALGTKVRTGERLYQLLSFNKHQKLPEVINVYAETDGLIFDLSTNQSVNQGEYVLDLLND